MEFCKKCIAEDCYTHKWFTDLKLKTEKEVLIAELNHILEYPIINAVVEKVHLVENQHLEYPNYWFSYVDCELNFKVNVPTSAKNGAIYYMPVMSRCGKDDVLDYQITINVKLMRHNPTKLIVQKSIFDDTILYSVELIDFCDNLHMESIDDYPEIVKLATSRLKDFIDTIKEKN